MKRVELGTCRKNKLDGTRCGAPACAIAVIQWSGERLPVCDTHLGKLRRALGSGVSTERTPAAELPH